MQAAWFKMACTPREDGSWPNEPTNPMGVILLAIVRNIWRSENLPPGLSAALIVCIHKSGDILDPDNYRGISLMEVILKILGTIVAQRIQRALDEAPEGQGLSYAQAGFRKHEEPMGNVVALMEILQRRNIEGSRTYVAFIDLKKAFDTVPFGALMVKIKRMGISDNTLRFVKALYKAPSVKIRGPNGEHGPEVIIERGVRQGCPLSPVLFDMFINDFFGAHQGVSLDPIPETFPGLLFADDAVVLADSEKDMVRALDGITEWCSNNHMDVGIQKCGIMIISASGRKHLKLVGKGDASPFKLQDQVVSPVDEYKYLGFHFNRWLSVEMAINNMAAKSNTIADTSFTKGVLAI